MAWCGSRRRSCPRYWRASTGCACMHAVSPVPQPHNDPHVRTIASWSAGPQISDSAAMALSFDDLPNDAEALKALLLSLRAETETARAETEAARADTVRIAADRDRLENEH